MNTPTIKGKPLQQLQEEREKDFKASCFRIGHSSEGALVMTASNAQRLIDQAITQTAEVATKAERERIVKQLRGFATNKANDYADAVEQHAQALEARAKEVSKSDKPKCSRCNDNSCPACDGTKGSQYNPEPF